MRLRYFIFLASIIFMTGCRHNHTTTADEESGHAHGAGSVPYTAYSDSCEYFAEIQPMVKGKPAEAAIHITRLSNHRPFTEGTMTVNVVQDGRLIGSGETNKPRIPGIFPVAFTVAEAGNVSVKFVFRGEGLTDSVTVALATVYETETEASHAEVPEEPAGVIKFTKEMAWKVDFSVMEILPREYHETILVTGELAVPPSQITTLSATCDGILVYRREDLVSGAKVSQGSTLFSLTGQGLTSRNLDATVSALKSKFETARETYDREKPLVKEQIVSLKQFNETASRYRIDSVQYFAYIGRLSGNNINLPAPVSGFIQQIYQPNGAFVTEGTPLMAIGNSDKILLRADLPQRNWKELDRIRSASFRPAGSREVFYLEKLGGRMMAKGSAVTPDHPFIPITFEFPNNGSFVAGTFAEIFLHTSPVPDQIVIPVSALMEEQGIYYVFVQVAGESFVKRIVKTGFPDGNYTSVISGLISGDRVVTRGATFIKASSQMTGTPSHGHEH